MSKNLVIVESPAKAKSIGKILGSDFTVLSSVGHIRDLPQRALGIEIEKNFEPKYVVSPGKTKIVEELRKAARIADEIYLAPDPDREGEAIAWHLQEVLATATKGKPVHRVSYNEITPRAVRAAFEKPGKINMHRVDAQQGRRIIDRIVGYQVSPMLWRRIRRGLSAGRVQSVALRLLCERERLIQAFVPEAYWVIGALLHKLDDKNDKFTVKLAQIDGKKASVTSEETAKATLDELKGRKLRVSAVNERDTTRRPLPPFITSTLQQAASSFLGYAPGRTMSLAQKLYEGIDLGDGSSAGLITYMRTDSPTVSRDAQAETLDYIRSEFGAEFAPEKPNFYRGRSDAQEAHEAIRPTDVRRTPASLAGRLSATELKLYDLIWRRFVASQMVAARLKQRTALIDSESPPAQQHHYRFSATSTEVVFPGFLRVMELDLRKSSKSKPAEGDEEEQESDAVERLPLLAAGEEVALAKWLSERKETKPPSRYSEAALIRALEADGVGRPSTYAAILETLQQREYATREKRILVPTPLGFQVCDLLVDKLNQLFEVGFTASMEQQLDEVEAGEVEWRKLMADFYARFTAWMEAAREPAADKEKVEAVLAEFKQVTEWAPSIKRGRRIYDDAKFIESVAAQHEGGGRPITERQLDTIVKMALRYHEQIPGVRERIIKLGFVDLATAPETQPPRPETASKFDLLRGLELSGEQRRFVSSLEQQSNTGRRLSEAQVSALNRVVIANARRIPDFEKVCQELDISVTADALAPDQESPRLLAALSEIKEWREPTKRGKRTFDDQAFVKSVADQFGRKGALSERQRAAMKKLLIRYRDQISNIEKRMADLGMKPTTTEEELEASGNEKS